MTGNPGIPPQAREALARGDRIEAIRQIRDANPGLGLATAMQMLEAHVRAVPAASVHPDHARGGKGVLQSFLTEAFATMSDGSKLDRIRQVRERTGTGLREAATLVEAERDDDGDSRNARIAERMRDLARRHGLQVPQSALEAMAAGETFHALDLVRKTNNLRWRDMRRLMAGRHIARPAGGSTVARGDRRVPAWALMLIMLAGLALGYYLLAR